MKLKAIKYSKKITAVCVIMDIIITAALLVLMFCGRAVDAALAVTMYGAFNVELGFSAVIKILEKKDEKTPSEDGEIVIENQEDDLDE